MIQVTFPWLAPGSQHEVDVRDPREAVQSTIARREELVREARIGCLEARTTEPDGTERSWSTTLENNQLMVVEVPL